MGNSKYGVRYTIEFKHEACQYYEHHTNKETCEKFGITSKSLCDWRKELGYRNKYLGRNINDRKPRNFKSIRGANGKYTVELLQKRITDLETKIVTMQPDVELAQSIRNLFN